MSRRERMNAAVSGEHLVGVHLVAEQQQRVGPGTSPCWSRLE